VELPAPVRRTDRRSERRSSGVEALTREPGGCQQVIQQRRRATVARLVRIDGNTDENHSRRSGKAAVTVAIADLASFARLAARV